MKFEIVSFDNKLSPQETVNALQAAIDQGIRYVAQGTGTGRGDRDHRLPEQVQRAQPRQGSAVPELRRGRPRSDQQQVQLLALPPRRRHVDEDGGADHLHEGPARRQEGLPDQPELRPRPPGRQVRQGERWRASGPTSRSSAKTCTPLAQTRDFAPYIAKIKASGADTVVTGNWSSDLTLLVKAANDGGLNAKFFTYYAGVTGTPTAMGANAAGRVFQVAVMPTEPARRCPQADGRVQGQVQRRLLHRADLPRLRCCSAARWPRPRAPQPIKVAAALEGLKVKGLNGDVADAQDRPPAAADAVHRRPGRRPASRRYDYSVENTGYTFAPLKTFEPYVSSTPTSCQMKRPGWPAPERLRRSRRAAARSATRAEPVRCSHLKYLRAGTMEFRSLDQRAERRQRRAAAVHAQLGPDADLQHDGRAELRPRQLLHAGCLLRLLHWRGWSASGPALVLAPLAVGLLGALFERTALRRVHKFGHVPELLITFGLSLRDPRAGQAGLGPVVGASSRRRQPCRAPAFTIVQSVGDGLGAGLGRGARRRAAPASARRSCIARPSRPPASS